ncbi:dehydrogenase [Acetobacter indonesiensis]|uniref:PQQ-binding-like beta-propeller repeat protein n=1 Tax=Acetobacter indonesiensis TaxID=104101 RepID=UPI000A3C2A39|nr:PQQ-binding-like beta-propeller repeat protein [Acetobacter indonesiensis]OUI97282.1 dehydrogenase [Acetobacter indonesiensis]
MSKTRSSNVAKAPVRRRTLLAGAALAPALGACSMFDDDEKPVLAGHRTDVLSSGSGLEVDKEDHTPITLPEPVTVSDWPLVGRVTSHVGSNYRWGGLRERWSKSVGASISEPDMLAWAALGSLGRGLIQSPPVISGGRLFIMDAQGVVRGFSWPRMSHLWTLNPKPKKMRSSNMGGGLAVDGDTVYIVSGIADALAVNAETGKVKWRVDIGAPGRSPPTVVDGRMFFGTLDERFFALDAATGRQLWSYGATQADTTVFGQPAPAYTNGVVIAGFGGGDLVAFRAETGEIVWSDMLGNVNSQASTLNLSCVRGLPVVVDSTIYAVSMAQVLAAVDIRTGRRQWERAIASQNSILCVGDWLFIVSLDEQLACIDRLSGHVRWITQLRRFRRVDVGKDIVTWIGPVMAGGQLVCISTLPGNGVVRVNPVNGAIISVDSSNAVSFVPPIVVDEQMLIITNDGKLRSYG